MSEIHIPANAIGDTSGKGMFIDPNEPPAKPVQMWRVKGSKQIVSHLPPGANTNDFEPYTPQAQKTIRYPLHYLRDYVREAMIRGRLPADTDVEALAQHLFETKNVVEPLP